MCGVAGIFRKEGLGPDDCDLVLKMLHKQQHRGPDAQGLSVSENGVLGHNRLAILDLSPTSDQPFIYQHITMVFNGEVYNYQELRATLKKLGYQFNTEGDTEVICAAYLHWGEKCVEKFVGMWAFAIWDSYSKMLFCSRDRFGIKPFYYILDGRGAMFFASEIRTLKVLPNFPDILNEAQVSRGLNLGLANYRDETYYTQVLQLPLASNLIWRNGKIQVYRYWDLEKRSIPSDFETATDEYKELFKNSMELHMRSDVEIGANLSGGIDSSAIVSYLAFRNPVKRIKTFTIYYEGLRAADERSFAETLSKKYSNVESHYFQPDDHSIFSEFERFLDHADVPVAGSSFYSQYFVMKLAASNGMKVLLNGQGSDEYNIGYLHSFYHILADELRAKRTGKFIEGIKTLREIEDEGVLKLSKTAMLSMTSAFFKHSTFSHAEYLLKYPKLDKAKKGKIEFHLEDKFKNRIDNSLYHMIMTTTLPTLLHYEDRNSMAFSIESRVPFLDHRLVEYGFSLPVDYRVRERRTKYILRVALKDILPEPIYQRKDKKGFITPGESLWVKGPLSVFFGHSKGNPKYSWRQNMLEYYIGSSQQQLKGINRNKYSQIRDKKPGMIFWRTKWA